VFANRDDSRTSKQTAIIGSLAADTTGDKAPPSDKTLSRIFWFTFQAMAWELQKKKHRKLLPFSKDGCGGKAQKNFAGLQIFSFNHVIPKYSPQKSF